MYGPGDLPSASGNGGTFNGKGGNGGGGGQVTWGGAGFGTGGHDSNGGHTEEGGQGEPGGAGAGGSPSGGAVNQQGGTSGSNSTGATSNGGIAGSGTGGVQAAGGNAAGGITSGGAPPVVPPQLIDDMEDTDGQIYVQPGTAPPNTQRDGYWYTSADTANGGSVVPAQGTMILMTALNGDVGAGGASTYAFHFSGVGGPSPSWGALGGFDIKTNTGATKHPYDASAYKGIRFYAKAATAVTISVRLPIRDTTLNADGAKCGTKCEDHWFKKQPLTTTWAMYDLLWPQGAVSNGFAQSGWGYVAPFDAKTLVGVQFVITTALTGDIWIDDVSFLPL